MRTGVPERRRACVRWVLRCRCVWGVVVSGLVLVALMGKLNRYEVPQMCKVTYRRAQGAHPTVRGCCRRSPALRLASSEPAVYRFRRRFLLLAMAAGGGHPRLRGPGQFLVLRIVDTA